MSGTKKGHQKIGKEFQKGFVNSSVVTTTSRDWSSLMNTKGIILALAVAAVLLLIAVGSASAKECGIGIADCECGDTVVADWTFTEYLSCPAGHGLIIGADGITIDGTNHTLDGVAPGACDGMGVQRSGIYNKGHDDVVIKNLEVKNFCNGIHLMFDEDEQKIVYRNVIHNCEIHHNGNDTGGDTSTHGIKLIGVSDSEIKNCKVHHNAGKGEGCEAGGNGIFLKGTSSGDGGKRNLITGNEIYENAKAGFFTKMKPEYTNVTYNKIWGNSQGGIVLRCMLSAHHLIEHNEVNENYGSGIFIGGPNNIISHNVVKNNMNGSAYTGAIGEYGIGINLGRNDGSFDNELISNEVCGNEGVDIEVAEGCSGNHGRNNTCDRTKNYNDKGTTGCTYAYAGAGAVQPVPTPADTATPAATAEEGEGISILIGLPQFLQSAIYLVSTSLLYPVIIILLGLTALLVVEIGMFSFEGLARTGRLKRAETITEKGIKKRLKRFFSVFAKHEPKDLERGVLEAKTLMDNGEFEEGINVLDDCTSKRFVYAFLDGLSALKAKDTELNNPGPVFAHLDIFSINIEKLLQKLEIMVSKRLERTKVTVRLGPMFGLMGTLIPMGPALIALTKGDVNTLASNLIIAFGTTVVGLLVGGISYLIFTIRTRWYKQDMNDIHYVCEVLFGGE